MPKPDMDYRHGLCRNHPGNDENKNVLRMAAAKGSFGCILRIILLPNSLKVFILDGKNRSDNNCR